jgi:copper oxidase (laccase) domain-containing protein
MLIIRSNIFNNFSNITFGLSTKIGNEKNIPFHFNMSKSIGDDEERVKKNRKVFFSKFNLDPENVIIQKQIHSDIINIVDKHQSNLEGDALITQTPNLGLAISTADCNNIYIYDKSKK